ncbi:MAG: ABC transporter substrate-binding protein, partial [Candidatus Eremiobacteraeota bacterium]|nr:ABC transporter substrate-binding protein [Candidatus Eremiobacteraeota bacterium]
MTRSDFILYGSGCCYGSTLAQTGAASLRAIVFPSASQLPFWAAQAIGAFSRQGLSVTIAATPGSVYLFQHLAAGDFEIGFAAFDNAVAYDEGQGEAQLPAPAEFVAFMGCENGMQRIIARPEIGSLADLRGKTVALDAPGTGYAFLLYKALELGGLRRGDYRVESVGGTQQRFMALASSDRYAATLVNPPYDLQLGDRGFRQLSDPVELVGRYQGIAGLTTRSWMSRNLGVLTRFVRAYLAGLAWIYDPANRVEAVAL